MSSNTSSDSESICVLMIEDDQDFAVFAKDMLSRGRRSIGCECVHNLAAGLKQLQCGHFDVVLLDLFLPDSDGLTTFQVLQSSAPKTPIVVLSGSEDDLIAQQAVHHGAQDFLMKGHVSGELLERAIVYAIERSHLVRKLRDSEERYALAAAGANDGLWDWNIAENDIHFSPRWKAMLGYGDAEIGGSPDEWFRLIHRDDFDRFNSELSLHLNDVTSHFECEYRIRHKDGRDRWMQARGLAVRDDARKPVRMAGSQTEITARKVSEAKLFFEAHHDALTILPNRKVLHKRLSRMIDHSTRRGDRRFGLLFVDLDRFKRVNDSLGHSIGDELLVALARRLQECVRPGDLVVRMGGDEFAILLDEITGAVDAVRVAERIHESLKTPVIVEGHHLAPSASIGIVLNGEYETAADMIRDADNAMYRAKADGRGKHTIFDATMHQQAVHTLKLESDLRRAVEEQQFENYYQPIVSLVHERIVGFEALLRWNRPGAGLVPPDEFIPAAEDTGLIVRIGESALREACLWIRQLQSQFSQRRFSINVNLSARQVAEGNLTEMIGRVLKETGVNPRDVIVRMEITESALMEGSERELMTLLELKELDIHLCMDDFGTGYSSLSYLHRYPIDVLKIDKSFISRLGVSCENAEIVQTILSLAHSVGIIAVAEGVESSEQALRLREMGCEFGQGYLFSIPLPGRLARELIDQEARIVNSLRKPASAPPAAGEGPAIQSESRT